MTLKLKSRAFKKIVLGSYRNYSDCIIRFKINYTRDEESIKLLMKSMKFKTLTNIHTQTHKTITDCGPVSPVYKWP